MPTKPIYILGTGLSHDGSSCILKDGEIIVAIEKERLTRVKHDGGNDYETVKYCLDAAGITMEDLSLIVQAANFEKDIMPHRYQGKRFFPENGTVPVITISHHLAHAWAAVGASPFESCHVLVLDGAGSPYNQCDDLTPENIADEKKLTAGMHCEKDSFCFFDGQVLFPVRKDFSEVRLFETGQTLKLPTNYHSIGGLYSAASNYCFGNMDDAGKLMGLAPYGNLTGNPALFNLANGTIEVNYKVIPEIFTEPAADYSYFKSNFQHYADIARWVQDEAEKAIQYIFESRLTESKAINVAYAGGVALNAVANAKLKQASLMDNFFPLPTAGDNGLALGCAYYGWLAHLKQKKAMPSGSPFLGRTYSEAEILQAIQEYETKHNVKISYRKQPAFIQKTAEHLAAGKVVAWFQGGAEFGPRALGHRSILADPRRTDIKNHINANIKFREDFRPFAPAVRKENAAIYFQHAWESPYMILIDWIKPEWKKKLPGIVHRDKSCRVQTITPEWNKQFYDLLGAFEESSGIGVLLNTSLNKRGMPIVETPFETLDFFFSCALDVLVLENYIIEKP